MNALKIASLIAVLALSPRLASATLITVNGSDFQLGQDVSESIAGLTMHYLSNTSENSYQPEFQSVFVQQVGDRTQFGLGVGNTDAFYRCSQGASGACAAWRLAGPVLEFVFDRPTNYFSVDGFHGYENLDLIAFNAAGEAITGTWLTGYTSAFGLEYGVEEGFQRAWVSFADAQITRIWYGSAQESGVYAPHRIQFETPTVPEPGTLGLLGMGVAWLGFARRRNRTGSGL